MMNYDIKVKLKADKKCICDCDSDKVKNADPNDAKLELTAACAEYVNAVAPGKKFDVKDLGNAVAGFIADRLCLNPDKEVPADGKWHNVEYIDEPGLKIEKWVKKFIG